MGKGRTAREEETKPWKSSHLTAPWLAGKGSMGSISKHEVPWLGMRDVQFRAEEVEI